MTAPARRWYRQPVAWLVLALPVASVAATIWLLGVAGGPGATDAAPEPVQRMAQVQQGDFAADAAAARRGLRATLRRDGAGFRVEGLDDAAESPLSGAELAGAKLLLVHPADATRDLALPLDAEGRASTADYAHVFDDAVAWRLRLAPADGSWRLVGRWVPRASAPVELRPAVDAPAETTR